MSTTAMTTLKEKEYIKVVYYHPVYLTTPRHPWLSPSPGQGGGGPGSGHALPAAPRPLPSFCSRLLTHQRENRGQWAIDFLLFLFPFFHSPNLSLHGQIPFPHSGKKGGGWLLSLKAGGRKERREGKTQLLDHITSFISGFMLFLKSTFFYILKYFTRKDLLIV